MKWTANSKNILNYYLRTLSVLYFVGFALHVADLIDLRLKFSEMNSTWQSWIVFLTIADFITAIGLWRQNKTGIIGFHVVAVTQVIAYSIFAKVFSFQIGLIIFHVVTLLTYHLIRVKNKPPSGVIQ